MYFEISATKFMKICKPFSVALLWKEFGLLVRIKSVVDLWVLVIKKMKYKTSMK